MKKQFFKNLKITNTKKINIFYPGVQTVKKFPVKKNIILFVGKLNRAKGYDIILMQYQSFLKIIKHGKE